jgi:hypothetical protein
MHSAHAAFQPIEEQFFGPAHHGRDGKYVFFIAKPIQPAATTGGCESQ